MTPPAPMPEHEFERFLRENNCRSEHRGSGEYAILRESDGRLVSTYAVKHKGKREVKPVYKTNLLKALERIRLEEESADTEPIENVAIDGDQSWQRTEWHQEQEKLIEEWKRLQEAEEGTT